VRPHTRRHRRGTPLPAPRSSTPDGLDAHPASSPSRHDGLGRGLVAVLLAGALLTGCTAAPTEPATATTRTTKQDAAKPAAKAAPRPDAASARKTLADLPVKGRAPRTGYDRDEFGPAWADVDRNGCDTRNDVLRRDLTKVKLKPGTRGCVVLSGTLADPYTGERIEFVRGPRSSEVQIDHVVALSDAWQKGAQRLDEDEREHLANDPLNLLAVDGPTNQSKGDGDAATWLPRRKAYRCAYVARQVQVKARYELWVTKAEKAAISRILAACS
jgi:integrase